MKAILAVICERCGNLDDQRRNDRCTCHCPRPRSCTCVRCAPERHYPFCTSRRCPVPHPRRRVAVLAGAGR